MQRHRFDVGEIEFVAANMDACTRDYVKSAREAAMRRARRKDWPADARQAMSEAASTMKRALDTWPRGHFDMRISRGGSDDR